MGCKRLFLFVLILTSALGTVLEYGIQKLTAGVWGPVISTEVLEVMTQPEWWGLRDEGLI